MPEPKSKQIQVALVGAGAHGMACYAKNLLPKLREAGLVEPVGVVDPVIGTAQEAARAPIQWDDSTNCGFSECTPVNLYLPVDPEPKGSTVAEQEARPDSLLHRVRALTQLHRRHPALAADAAIEIPSAGGTWGIWELAQ